MRLRRRYLAIAAACGIAVAAPAYALQEPTSSATVTATDTSATSHAWVGGDATIARGGTVTFQYPSGSSMHWVGFTDAGAQPTSCSGLPASAAPPGWTGTCRFDTPGTFAFACPLHPSMTGTITVKAPAEASPTATATPTGAPGGSASPGAGGGSPAPGGGAIQTTFAVSLARAQTGSRVRGSVDVKAAGSRLQVDVWAPRRALSGASTKPVRIGRLTRESTPAGRSSFAVGIDAKGRSALRRHRRLSVTVIVALTPPDGHELTRSIKTTLRAG